MYNDGIAVTQLCIFGNQVFLGLFILAVHKLLASEPAGHASLFMNLLQYAGTYETAFQLLLRKGFVSFNDNLVDLNLALLVHIHIQNDSVWSAGIIARHYVNLRILITFLIEVFLCQNLGTVDHIGCELIILYQTQFLFQVLTLVLLYTVVVDLRNSGARGQLDMQKYGIVSDAVCTDGHIAEQSVAPITLDGLGNLFAGKCDNLPHRQATEADKQFIIVICHAFHHNIADDILSWRAAIVNDGIQLACLYLGARVHRQHRH